MVKFILSPAGRMIRFILGLYLIYWGFLGDAGWIVGVIGFLPLLSGIFNFCMVAPLFGLSFMGVGKAK